MQDFGRTPATALRMSMVTRAAGFAGLSPPSLSLLDITSTRVILSPPPYKIIFYTRFYRFSATEERNSSILENFGAELLRKFVFDETLPQLLHSSALRSMGVAHFPTIFHSSLAIGRSLNRSETRNPPSEFPCFVKFY